MHNEITTTGQQDAGAIITASEISGAYLAAIGALVEVGKAAHIFAEKCEKVGGMLLKKKQETAGGWLAWLEANCPEISARTAQRLIKIHQIMADASRGTHKLELPARLDSIRGLYDALQADKNGPEETQTKTKQETKPSPLISALSGFWRVITKRPPEKWEAEERQEFLIDLAEREKVRRKNGWDMPVIEIDIEAEVIGQD